VTSALLHTPTEAGETRLDRELADVRETQQLRRHGGSRRRRREAALVRLEVSADVRSRLEAEAFHRIYAACGQVAVDHLPRADRFRRVDQAAGIVRMLRSLGVFDRRAAGR
jgi:hypothetical protein